jgi:transposase
LRVAATQAQTLLILFWNAVRTTARFTKVRRIVKRAVAKWATGFSARLSKVFIYLGENLKKTDVTEEI